MAVTASRQSRLLTSSLGTLDVSLQIARTHTHCRAHGLEGDKIMLSGRCRSSQFLRGHRLLVVPASRCSTPSQRRFRRRAGIFYSSEAYSKQQKADQPYGIPEKKLPACWDVVGLGQAMVSSQYYFKSLNCSLKGC